jgi:hypothetical protein
MSAPLLHPPAATPASADGLPTRVAAAADPSAAADPLASHVLPPDAAYLRNLEVLWAADPGLARLVEAVADADVYPVQPTRDGGWTVSLPTPAGRFLPLHSKYDPVAEAARLVASLDVDKLAAFYVYGFGLGYHVEALAARAGDDTPIFVFEPDLRLLRTAFEHRDFSALLDAKRLHFVTAAGVDGRPDAAGLPDKADLIVRLSPHLATLSLGVGTVDHGPSLQVRPAFYAEAKRQVEEFSAYARTTLNTVLLNSTRTAENIARNVARYAAAPSLGRLKDRFKGRPAVVVSAGPSLRKNKHLLHEVEGKAVVIAVQTTLQPLVEMGVEPHFVTSLDYHDISARFFENLPRGKPLRTELVAEPKATSKVLDLWAGNATLLKSDYADGLLREMMPAKDGLQAGATVAHLSFYLAEYLGCDPIIFLGQDLGFSDGLFYAAGTSYEDVWRPETGRFCTPEMKQWDQIVRERFLLRRIPDFQGNPMYTEERMYTYLQQFERDFLRSDRTVIDATEGGAAKRGSTPMPFAQAIQTYCTEPFPVDLSDHPGRGLDRAADCAGSLRKRRDEASRIEALSAETLPLLEEIRDHAEDQSRVNRAITKLDALRAKMNALGPTYDLVTELTQKSQLDRFAADRRIKMAKLDPAERQRRQVARDIANVQGVLDAAKRFQDLMGEVIERLAAAETPATHTAAVISTPVAGMTH